MKIFVVVVALILGLSTSALACPQGYYACGQNKALCCPR